MPSRRLKALNNLIETIRFVVLFSGKVNCRYQYGLREQYAKRGYSNKLQIMRTTIMNSLKFYLIKGYMASLIHKKFNLQTKLLCSKSSTFRIRIYLEVGIYTTTVSNGSWRICTRTHTHTYICVYHNLYMSTEFKFKFKCSSTLLCLFSKWFQKHKYVFKSITLSVRNCSKWSLW